ncbi:MAG TPA: hypothetical protein VE604_09480 [Candidatus Polarisedimenticolia bacterium]|nr:hypothetical protein [Candidatus Polarisedimenticolia bacterium]
MLQKAGGCVYEVLEGMDINTEIAAQSSVIRFTDIAGIGICILFSGATKPTRRKY